MYLFDSHKKFYLHTHILSMHPDIEALGH